MESLKTLICAGYALFILCDFRESSFQSILTIGFPSSGLLLTEPNHCNDSAVLAAHVREVPDVVELVHSCDV